MTDPRLDDLPPLLIRIAEATDLDTALRLAEHYGGRRVDIPNKWPKNWLVTLVGESQARAIVAAIGYGRVDIPLGPTGSYAAFRRQLNRRYAELEQAGGTEASIARALGLTDRAVRYRRARERQRQADMFGDGTETLPGRE